MRLGCQVGRCRGSQRSGILAEAILDGLGIVARAGVGIGDRHHLPGRGWGRQIEGDGAAGHCHAAYGDRIAGYGNGEVSRHGRVRRVECFVVSQRQGGTVDGRGNEGGCPGVDQHAGGGADAAECQHRVVASRIVQRATVGRQRADGDAVVILVAIGDGVAEHQRRAAAAGRVIGVHRAAGVQGQGEARRAARGVYRHRHVEIDRE